MFGFWFEEWSDFSRTQVWVLGFWGEVQRFWLCGSRRLWAQELAMTTIRRSAARISSSLPTSTLTILRKRMAFYQTYMARWPDYCHVAEAPNGSIMDYKLQVVYFKMEILCLIRKEFGLCLRLRHQL